MRLKERARRLIESRHFYWGIALVSFLESTVLPVPLEALLLPAMQARQPKAYRMAAAAWVGCLLGALAGYAVGFFLFEWFGTSLLDWVGSREQFDQARDSLNRNGFWFVLSVGVTPVPFQIAMLAAGVTGFSLMLYLLATGLSRGLRYFALAWLVRAFGDEALSLFEKHRITVGALCALVVLLSWAALYFLG